MVISNERIVTILGFMYGYKAEVVIDIPKSEWHLFIGIENHQFKLNHEEVNFLIFNKIIELDGGCNEEGHETEVYILTDLAQERIRSILSEKKNLLQLNK